MRKIFLPIVLMMAVSCNPSHPFTESKPLNLDSLKDVLKQTDLAFSDLSKSKGRNVSFLEYMDQHVTMLRPNSMPLVSKDTMQKIYSRQLDTSYILIWKPLFADIAASGDLGYTYGTWLLSVKSGETEEGTYCTIWKPDANGNWKFVLDTGNEGLKPREKK